MAGAMKTRSGTPSAYGFETVKGDLGKGSFLKNVKFMGLPWWRSG